MIDTTYVQPVTELVTSPSIMNWITRGIISLVVIIVSFLVGLFNTPKSTVIKILKFAALVFGAIIEAQNKQYPDSVLTATRQADKLSNAVTTLEQGILSSEHKSFFEKATKWAGGAASVINIAVPLIKQFIKGKK